MSPVRLIYQYPELLQVLYDIHARTWNFSKSCMLVPQQGTGIPLPQYPRARYVFGYPKNLWYHFLALFFLMPISPRPKTRITVIFSDCCATGGVRIVLYVVVVVVVVLTLTL